MTCPKCGASNLEGAKFCDACGTKLEIPAPGGDAKKRFCSSCGASLNPSARFCGSCGAAQGGIAGASAAPAPQPAPSAPAPQPAPSAPAPQPAPSAPAPREAPAYQAPAPQPPPPSVYQAPAPRGPSSAAEPKRKGFRTGCMVLAVLLVALAAGGYYLWNNVVLSNPAALVGTWQIDADQSEFVSEKFAFEPIEGGVKLVPTGPDKWPFELVLVPAGSRTFVGMVTSSAGEPSGVTIFAELRSFTTLNLKATMADGSTEEVEATRVLGSDNPSGR